MSYSNWQWPNIPGLHDFEGVLIHSAAWKDDCDLNNKRVAVLGCGSSGVQIVPAIQPGMIKFRVLFRKLVLTFHSLSTDVKHLTTFIRTPTWITSGFAQDHAGPGGTNFECVFDLSTTCSIVCIDAIALQ